MFVIERLVDSSITLCSISPSQTKTSLLFIDQRSLGHVVHLNIFKLALRQRNSGASNTFNLLPFKISGSVRLFLCILKVP